MSEYLLINILIISIPLALSFEKNIKFYKKFSSVFISITSIGIIFLVWDIIAVSRGDWSFNKEYVYRSEISGLPFEEILFFVTVPFSTLFIYETLNYYIKERTYSINVKYFYISAVLFFMIAVLNYDRYYTATVFTFCGVIILLQNIFMPAFVISKNYLLTLLISFIPFLIVNYYLTSLPVVIYNPEAITGIRFLTIPFEDFFYSFSMISCWLLVYRWSEKYERNIILKNDKSKA